MATHKRSRTGCWTCRGAGYKCDEQKPYCGRCVRLKITCKGYGVKLKWQDDNISTPAKRPRRATRKTSVETASISSSGSVINFSSTQATFTSPRDLISSPESTYSLPLIAAASPQLTTNLSSNDRWLLHYWVEQLSSLISVAPRRDHTTPFQLHLTAMVHGSDALRSTVLSMAANHLALASEDPSLRIQAYRHQQDAIHHLQHLIQDPLQSTTEPALATVLMMQISARLFGTDNDASVANHLAGAKAMITRRDTHSESASTRFLLSLFAYHDILSSVSRGAPPLAEHDANFTAVEGEPAMRDIARILLVVARISRLQHAIKVRRAHASEPALSEDENATGTEIQTALLAMELCPSQGQVSDINLTASAYRHAAFIYLYRTWLSIGAPNPITLSHVSACLSAIQRVPASSSLSSSHIWPLFTAGCEAVDVGHRAFVQHRFEDMYSAKRFPSLRRVMRDMEDVWSAKEQGGEGVDCIQVVLGRRGREVDLA
jgi:hypothetical protein